MKVIFLKDIPFTAKVGEIKDVTTGFARNFLFPQHFAVIASEAQLKLIERHAQGRLMKHEKKVKKVRDMLKKIQFMKLKMRVHSNKAGKLYAAIHAGMIVLELKAKKYEIETQFLHIPVPIKRVGEHKVELVDGNEMLGTITIEVVGEASE